MSNDKPWQKVWSSIWNFLTKGRRKWVTVPVFFIVVIAYFYPPVSERLGKTYRDLAGC